jgi:D-serine deaminase-like pyridoxal phosphate-dependent protein
VDDLGANAHLIGEPASRHRLMTPALVLDADALGDNIDAMAAFCRDAGVGVRPHTKTHKSVRIARLQMEAGALGVCVVTLGEAEVMVRGGIEGVLITSPVIGADKIARLGGLNAEARGLGVVADHPDAVDALEAAGPGLTVMVDFDVGSHRTGARDAEGALAVAQRIAQSNGLDWGGVQAYAGHLQHVDDFHERRRLAAEQAARVNDLAARLHAAGLAPPASSGAGTGTHAIDAAGGAFTEMQVGSYVFTDVQYNVVALRQDEACPFTPALFVCSRVVSANAPGFVTTDAGLKRFATDGPLPEVVRGAPEGATYRFMGDEHGAVVFAKEGDTLAAGSFVECLTPHCDPTVNLWDHYHVVRGDTLVDIWPVDGRGAV